MMKKTAFSVLLASAVSVAVAQDAAKDSKSSGVELNRTSKYKIINNKPIKVRGEAVLVEEATPKKSERPPAERKPVKAVAKPIPVKEKSDNKK